MSMRKISHRGVVIWFLKIMLPGVDFALMNKLFYACPWLRSKITN
jgi:hypothetical protein